MPKKIAAGILALSLLSGCSSAAAHNFSLNLSLTSAENSKDSNSEIETLDIEGTHGEYTWTYKGHHPEASGRNKNLSFDLTEEQVESLKLFLKTKNLNQDINEKESIEELGNSVELSLKVEIDGKKSTVDLAGMSAIAGGDGGSNLQNLATLEAAQDLIYTVKDLAGLYDK